MPARFLIVSTSVDRPNFQSVINHLTDAGHQVIAYETDLIASGSQEFSAHIDAGGDLHFTYNGRAFSPQDIAAAWWRKPMYYGTTNSWRWLSIKDEFAAMHSFLPDTISAEAWLNNPQKMLLAQSKIPQLAVAAACGFAVPETLVANRWDAIEAFPYERLIVKMAKSSIMPSVDGKIENMMPATILDHDKLPKKASPYPGIWQPLIPKKREWRVTVVGEHVFAAAIYTKHTAKDDWRKHQFTSAVKFKNEEFPVDLQVKCRALLKHFGLRYGAFDFIEKPNGEIIFLEVNPNGQFKWLEDDLGLPISKAIADELIAISGSPITLPK